MRGRSKKKRREHAKSKRGRQLVVLAAVFLILALGVVLYCWRLSLEMEKRFSGRRWSIPSKVYSDTTILYPGQRINRPLLLDKLRNLGYRGISRKPERKGELRYSASSMDLYLHDQDMPSRKREGFLVKIVFSGDTIISMARPDNGEQVTLVELEPEEITSFFGVERERRQLVSINQAPKELVFAILAAEDVRFYLHHGLDFRGIARAFYENLRHLAIVQGGSAITQQLAKSYFLTPERTISRKAKEFLMSLVMEIRYTKNEILEIYLNEIYLGQKGSVSINGVGEAAHFYFSKPVSELSLAECATIAGLIRAPNYYSPYIDKARCQERRNRILQAMHKHGWISEPALRAASAQPVKASGFSVFANKAPYFVDYLAEQLKALYPQEALSSLGLHIYTTLDTEVQAAAEKALSKGLARLENSYRWLNRSGTGKNLEGALIVMQPKTGYILAMVGGRNYNETQFNRITQSRRQPGSAFKPFIYLTGLDHFTPASFFSNVPKIYDVDGKPWEPQNYEPDSEERVTMRRALAKSLNLATVDLAMQVGLGKVVKTASAFQFSTPFRAYPALALGAFEVIPLELARAYCAFAADGVLPYPLSLKEVVDESGQSLERRHMSIEKVTTPAKAFMMSSLMRSVVTDGTARALAAMGISFPVAGKTGTTNDYRDAWFVGYTPDILALVWVGFDNGDPIRLAGASAALPIWADLMNYIPEYVSESWFRIPPGVVKRLVCSETGQLAIPNICPDPIEEVYLEENVPTGYCTVHHQATSLEKIMRGIRDVIKQF